MEILPSMTRNGISGLANLPFLPGTGFAAMILALISWSFYLPIVRAAIRLKRIEDLPTTVRVEDAVTAIVAIGLVDTNSETHVGSCVVLNKVVARVGV